MKKVTETLVRFSAVAPAIGAIVLIVGAVQYLSSRTTVASNGEVSPMIIERKLAIEEAERKGEKTYSYTTRFIPGIGMINDPEAFKEDWQKQLEQQESAE